MNNDFNQVPIGLKDMDGNEIHEGDTLDTANEHSYRIFGKVTYIAPSFRYVALNGKLEGISFNLVGITF